MIWPLLYVLITMGVWLLALQAFGREGALIIVFLLLLIEGAVYLARPPRRRG